PLPRQGAARAGAANGSRRQRGRAPWGTISREAVVGKALELVEAGGYEAMTIRGLAAELGVAPMSLYHHVRDKDDLLDEVVDRLLAPAWRPPNQGQAWDEWVAEAAERLRRFLVSQPAALYVYLRHPVVSPAAIVRMEEMMRALRSSGADEQAARRAYGAIHTYTVGFAAMQASRAGWAPSGPVKPVARQLAAYTAPRQFRTGLHYILEGLQLHPRSGSEAPSRRGAAGPRGSNTATAARGTKQLRATRERPSG
ncbi:MAG: TetR/AcrR family transcriptional regulator, partial [Acidimicrobiales bacterium]